MNVPIRIAPSILSADFSRLAEAVQACERAGADAIHFDVMDGHFVPNLTVGPVVLRALRKETSLPFDVHLMIEAPLRTLDQYLEAGAARLSIHVEAEPHLHRFAQVMRAASRVPGLAINPGTSLSLLDEALSFVDFVLVMSVNPGWGGQPFLDGSLPRIASLASRIGRGDRNVEIAVDGGVTKANLGALVKAGARHFVAGSSVFGSGSGDVGARVTMAVAELRTA
ncbi:MAG: ribulose-phosphate 3-epimerase, partial [Acidobacteria bacterium]|nr:ribulose-phosphate 3-epimerase [Acidobacteriota bacterium]